ncbi:MAG: flagellar assembly protein FliX [Rhodospirillaceae bacterium]|jgi:hypothetical protein|nr:flagellar assembly protein FliX [Rhodospirillaceae bacterium]
MKVSSTGGPKRSDGVKKSGKSASGDSSFADSLKEAGGSGEVTPAGVSGVAGVDGILAAQGVSDPTDDRRQRQKLMTYGDDLLDRLDDLRMGILLGRFSKDKLTELAQRLRQKREMCEDPQLNDLLAEIELRAEVEIAKYTRKS